MAFQVFVYKVVRGIGCYGVGVAFRCFLWGDCVVDVALCVSGVLAVVFMFS